MWGEREKLVNLECVPQTSSSINWEFFRNTDPQAPPQETPESRTLGREQPPLFERLPGKSDAHSSLRTTAPDQTLANYSPQAKSRPLTVCVNKVLLAPSHAHSYTYVCAEFTSQQQV